MPYLKQDTYSFLNTSRCYGKAGDPVTIVNDRGGIYIVELQGGLRITLLPKDLTDEHPTMPSAAGDDKKEDAVAPKKTSTVRRQKRAQPPSGGNSPGGSGQGSLFG